METKESLDTKVLKILFDYYNSHRGDPQMIITDLYADLPGEDQGAIHAEILKLQEKDWVSCDLTTDGLTGFVKIEPKGLKVMSARPQPSTVSVPKPVVKVTTPSETPLALIPGVQYDIFVSYTGGDDLSWIEKTLTKVKKLADVQCSDYARAPQWVEHAVWNAASQC